MNDEKSKPTANTCTIHARETGKPRAEMRDKNEVENKYDQKERGKTTGVQQMKKNNSNTKPHSTQPGPRSTEGEGKERGKKGSEKGNTNKEEKNK